MVKLLSTLPAQVLEPLCGPRHSRFVGNRCGWRRSGRLGPLPRRVDASGRTRYAFPQASSQGTAGYDQVREDLRRLPVKGWDRSRDFANDPRNLLAVSGKGNFDKAFRDRIRVVGRGQGEAGHGRGARRLLVPSSERDEAAAGRERVRHRDVVILTGQPVDQLVVANHSDQPRRRIRPA